MMDFLDTLFRYEYFGPILFGIIAVLIIIFFIILFFGKKDEKERKLEETRRLELANANAFKEEDTEVALEVTPSEPMVVEPVVTPGLEEAVNEVPYEDSEINPFDSLSAFVETQEPVTEIAEEVSNVVEEPVLEPIETEPLSSFNPFNEVKSVNSYDDETVAPITVEEVMPTVEESMDKTPELKYNFTELASSLAQEIEDLEKLSINKNENKTAELKLKEASVEITPMKEIQKSAPRPVFSSVFVEPVKPVIEEPIKEEPVVINNEPVQNDEPVIKVEEKETINVSAPIIEEEVKVEETPAFDFSKLKAVDNKPNFTKPNIELPKHIEMPVKKVTPTETDKSVITPDFTSIEGESYTLK